MDNIDLMRHTAKASSAIATSATMRDVAQQAIGVAQLFGYHCVSLVERAPDNTGGDVLFSTGDSAFVQRYRREGMSKTDPLVNRVIHSDTVRSGSEVAATPLSSEERRTLALVAEASGCADALIIPVRRSVSPSGVIVFGGAKPDTGAAARAALTVLGHCAFGRVSELKQCGARQPITVSLSPRESEVLTWVAKGKCDSEISVILGMSERTARFHVANAKAKLETTSRVQAVTKAMELGLIAA